MVLKINTQVFRRAILQKQCVLHSQIYFILQSQYCIHRSTSYFNKVPFRILMLGTLDIKKNKADE